jgi:tRNA isopentenyl-2-thiomethyl-A-37 hydroxylase MiaE
VDATVLLKPVYERFLKLFKTLIKSESRNNVKYLDLLLKCYTSKKVTEFVTCLNHGFKSIRSKLAHEQDVEIQAEGEQL